MSILGNFIKGFLFLVFFASLAHAGKLSIHVSSKSIPEGESIKVTLSAKSKDVIFPDIVDVGGFHVSNRGTSSEYSLQSNGTTTMMGYNKSFTFSFYPEVNMTIPSYSVTIDGKEYKTKPVKIVVTQGEAPNNVGGSFSSDQYRLKLKTNKKEVYLGDSAMVDVEFFEPIGSNIARAEYNEPRFKDADVKVLTSGKTRRSSNGTTHIYSYLVTPRKEGTLSISAPSVRLAVRDSSQVRRDPFGGMFGGVLKWKNIKSNSLRLKVLPQMQSSDLVGSFTIKTNISNNNAKANEPIEYIVTIQGDGELDSLEDYKFEIDGVTSYGDDAIVKYRKDGDKLIGRYTKKYIFISDNSFTIPSFEVTYFDPNEKGVKVLKTKEQKIVIAGGAIMPKSNSKNIQKTTQEMNNTEENKSRAPVDSVLEDGEYYESKKTKPFAWYMWVMMFGIGLIVLGGAYWLFGKVWQSKRSSSNYSTDEALKILYPHVDKSPEIEQIVIELYEAKNGKNNKKMDKKRVATLIKEIEKD